MNVAPVGCMTHDGVPLRVSCVALYEGILSVRMTPSPVIPAPAASEARFTATIARLPPLLARTVYCTVGATTVPPTTASFCRSMRASATTGSLYWPTVFGVDVCCDVPEPACWVTFAVALVVIVPDAPTFAEYCTPIAIVPLIAVRNGPPALPVKRELLAAATVGKFWLA